MLLVEAGGPNDGEDLRVDGKRWLTFMEDGMNWGYKTEPQEHCEGRCIDYSRGKGLGGSSAINFGVYSIGAKDDYEEWARLVGDDAYGWEHMKRRFKEIENFHTEIPNNVTPKYAAPRSEDHGNAGKIHVAYAAEWEDDVTSTLDIFERAGYGINPDHNSGDPIGMSSLIESSCNGRRSTAKDLLTPMPASLTVKVLSAVDRVILDGMKAVGVSVGGTDCKCIGSNPLNDNPVITDMHIDMASKEVIISAGALDTPRILYHSGLGPREQLSNFNIPVVRDMPELGQNLRDHEFCSLVYKKKEPSQRGRFYGSPSAQEEALAQWKLDGTGPWAQIACATPIGWLKLPDLSDSDVFKALPKETQNYLNKESVPHFEFITHFPAHWFMPGFLEENLSYSSLNIFIYNAQSSGEVTLQSSDPSVPLKMDPKFLSDPFDRYVAVECLRAGLAVTQSEAWASSHEKMIAGPEGDSDEALLKFWRQTIASSWHMSGTARMGKRGDDTAVVDNDFRVVGMENLRVADMSVLPLTPSCHLQAAAYATGLVCAEKLIEEYGLH